jgi:sortase A
MERSGAVILGASVFVLLLTFYPVLKEEVAYQFFPPAVSDKKVRAINDEFGIIVPKIGANAVVVSDVDWQDASAYQEALTKGVAHAAGTAHPGENGNVFLFAHSGTDFFQATRYNAIFYLIDKLELGDEVTLWYHQQKFTYRVTNKKTVAPEQIEYLSGDPSRQTLTLMTCTPAGTTLHRLIVSAERVITP